MTSTKNKQIELHGRDLHIREDAPAAWFDDLYAGSNVHGEGVPWASMTTHPHFSSWLEGREVDGRGMSALVVGCGLGDDAIELERRGFDVTAFDVSETAVELCKRRFPQSPVQFVQADLLAPPAQWHRHFDFVLEIYTVQALPPVYESEAIDAIAGFVAPGGQALVIAAVGEQKRVFEQGPPWLLTPEHVDAFASRGLTVEQRRVGDPNENQMRPYTTLFSRPT